MSYLLIPNFRFDMIAAGYEHTFGDTLRYWRTRFLVIPSANPPLHFLAPSGEKLSVEECRLLGADRLAELFDKARWLAPEETAETYPPPKFLPTWLDPAASVLDDTLMDSLDDLNAAGPLGKPRHSTVSIAMSSAGQVVRAMRSPGGVPIHDHYWHRKLYPNSFSAREFVSWVVREYNDVLTREHAVEWGMRLQDEGVIKHVRGEHRFMDGCVP